MMMFISVYEQKGNRKRGRRRLTCIVDANGWEEKGKEEKKKKKKKKKMKQKINKTKKSKV